MAELQITKMNGCGNDFIIIDGIRQSIDIEAIIKATPAWCDRQTGVTQDGHRTGADGVIVVCPSDRADVMMRIINADGSVPEMCGNGIRCVAKYAIEKGLHQGTTIAIDSLAGVMNTELTISQNTVSAIKVDMGKPILNRQDIPIAGDVTGPVINEDIAVGGQSTQYTGVSMGNPHAVVFVDNLEAIDLEVDGPKWETHPAFPNKINTEFVEVKSRDHATMKVWERGTGPTLACGTGACAILVAGVLTDRLNREATISLPGGNLQIAWPTNDGSVWMTGPAQIDFETSISY